jgi:hypothetical protein
MTAICTIRMMGMWTSTSSLPRIRIRQIVRRGIRVQRMIMRIGMDRHADTKLRRTLVTSTTSWPAICTINMPGTATTMGR